jgi:hypothetical protein
MPGFIASLVPVPANWPIVGWVSAAADTQLAIICHRENGEWIPQYALKSLSDEDLNPQRIELPSCFSLDPLAVTALEQSYISVQAEMN